MQDTITRTAYPSCGNCGQAFMQHPDGRCPNTSGAYYRLPRSSGYGSVAAGVLCAFLCIMSLVAMAVSGGTVAQCSSGLGQFSQAASASVSGQCGLWTGIHELGIAGFIIFGVGVLASVAAYLYRTR